ncbi:MAG: peptidoglycan DD-metalloendopeptidase family protein [Clostridia bacterium]|nr:peptidoglycan DD-metalloendopeptidase family protein [Clostridia bacterium]
MKKFLKSLIIFIIISILVAYSNISMAANMGDLKSEKSNVQNKITSTEKKIDEISKEKEDALSQVQKLITQISDYQMEIDELNGKIGTLQNKITENEKQIKEDEEEYAKEQKALDARLVAMYKTGETSYLDFLLSSATLVDFISSYYLVSEVADYDTKMLEQLEAHKQKIEKEKTELETNKKELSNSKTTLESKQQGLKVMKKAKEDYVKDLSEDEKKLEAELSELASHEQSINKKIIELQRQYDEEQARKRAAAATNNSSSSSSSGSTSSYSGGGSSNYGFGYPVTNHHVGTGYGVAGRAWSSGHHTGVDFPVPSGTPVYSVGDGQVVDTGYNRAYGNYVEIYHGNNIYSFYAHASSVIVSAGQHVTKGQQVMKAGQTGNAYGAHLHFEIRTPGPRYANCVNPMNYLP